MKIIQVCNPEEYSPFPVSQFVSDSCNTDARLEDWARENERSWEEGEMFVIYANFTLSGQSNGQFEGIKLLKILRLLGYRQHCIVYSFESLSQILVECRFSDILLSCGTTYVQMPFIIDGKFCEQRINRLSEKDPTLYFRDEAMEWLKTRRHSLANWWGIMRMYEVLKACGYVHEGQIQGIDKVLKKESSYQGLLMNFEHFHGSRPKFEINHNDIESFQGRVSAIRKKRLKVAYIDDQAQEGWSYLLQILLYGKEEPELFFAPAVSNVDLDELATKIIDFDANLIILDIRLEQNDDNASLEDISGIRLIRKLVERHSADCPIMAFTASDKRDISEKVMDYGADGVWTKEGIDEGNRVACPDYSAFSLARIVGLVSQIDRLSGLEYGILYDCLKKIKEINAAADEFWWEEKKCSTNDIVDRTSVKKSILVNELIQLFHSHKKFLLATQEDVKSSAYDMLTVKLCRMLEIIHPSSVDENGDFVSLGRSAESSWPKFSIAAAFTQYLVAERNRIVHAQKFSRIGAFRYKKTLEVLFKYLTLKEPDTLYGSMSGMFKSCINKKDKEEYYVDSEMGKGFLKFDKESSSESYHDRIGTTVTAQITIPGNQYFYKPQWIVPEMPETTKWTADAFLYSYESSSKEARISLMNIRPSQKSRFLVSGEQDDLEKKAGMTVSFAIIDWKNTQERNTGYYVYDIYIPIRPSEAISHALWTGRLASVESRSDGKTMVSLTDINPPFNAFIKLNNYTIKPEHEAIWNGNTRLAFLPNNWTQPWMISLGSQRQHEERDDDAKKNVPRRVNDATHNKIAKKKQVLLSLDAVNLVGGADAVKEIAKISEAYIVISIQITCSSLLHEKVSQVSSLLGEDFTERIILCNDIAFLKGDCIIDVRDSESVTRFDGRKLTVGSDEFPDWTAIIKHLKTC